MIPATQAIYLQAMEEGLLKIFIEAGAVVSTCGTCGPAWADIWVFWQPENAVSPPQTGILWDGWDMWIRKYICQPGCCGASAVTGKISSPEELEA